MQSFIKFFYEDFNDLGKLSPEKLIRGQRLDPSEVDNFKQVDGRVFYDALKQIIQNDNSRANPDHISHKFYKNIKDSLSVYDISDYKKMRCFLGKNNSSGFVLKDGDELISVFSSLNSSGSALVKDAMKEGARRLDCFATQDENGNIQNEGLVKLYGRHGFHIDENMNDGTAGEAYAIQNGISYFVDESGNVEPKNPMVVVFMKI